MRRLPSFLVAISLLFLAGSCVTRLERRSDSLPPSTVDGKSPWLKAHVRDGRVYVLSSWSANATDGRISGQGQLLDANRQLIDEGAFTVAVDSIAIFETNVSRPAGAIVGLSVVTGISAAIGGYCLSDPKACFGSCPTFYVDGEAGEILHAEGFSASIAPALEATDVDALNGARPRGRELVVRMRNEALETHVVRSVRLLAAPRSAGGRVYADDEGRMWSARAAVAPLACAAEGGDCLAALAAADGRERTSPADSTDLAARETIDLRFVAPPAGRLGVVVTSRQTLLSTFLLYQAFAWLGRDAARVLGSLERDSAVRGGLGGPGALMGGIEVLLRDEDGVWRVVGETRETGPLARDTRVVTLPPLPPGPLEVRLRLTRGFWRLDAVALASVQSEVEPFRIEPAAVRRGGVADEEALAALLDPDRQLVTMPGDEVELVFRLPDDSARLELFLESRGYYLEWMRSEWLAEENPIAAARLFLDPGGSLRALAPAYKRHEAGMEAIFWNSRYAPH